MKNTTCSLKPPLGLTPRYIRDEQRRAEIQAAICRYIDNGNIEIPLDWIEEYNEIITRQDAARLNK